ncbi:MAG: LVIVD repeat-containing protein [Verrucomicrobiota bacterium]
MKLISRYHAGVRLFSYLGKALPIITTSMFCMANTTPMFAEEPDSPSPRFRRVANWPDQPHSPVLEVAIQGHFAYLAIGDGGLLVIDIEDSTAPQWVGHLFQGKHVKLVRVYDDELYVATSRHRGSHFQETGNHRGQLHILNLESPEEPSELANYPLGSEITSLDFQNDHLLIGEGDFESQSAIRRLDVSDPSNPKLMDIIQLKFGREEIPVPSAVKAVGDQFFVSGGSSILMSDWENTQFLNVVGRAYDQGVMRGWQVGGQYVYTTRRNFSRVDFQQINLVDTFLVFDTSDSPDPSRVASLDFSSLPVDGSSNGVFGLDGGYEGLRIQNGYAYVCTGIQGLSVIDIRNPVQPVLVGQIDTSGNAIQLEIKNGLAYVADFHGGLQIIDISDPTQLRIVGQFETGLTPRQFLRDGDLGILYSADERRHRTLIEFLDLTVPASPTKIGEYRSSYSIDALEYSNDLLFIIGKDNNIFKLETLDASSPASIQSLSRITLPLEFRTSPVPNMIYHSDRKHLYVTGMVAEQNSSRFRGFLNKINLSNPANPQIIEQFITEGIAVTEGLLIDGSHLYQNSFVYGGKDQLESFSIEVPLEASSSGKATLPDNDWKNKARRVGGLHVTKGMAYVGEGQHGFSVVDVNDPMNPVFRSDHAAQGEVMDLEIYGNYLLTAEGEYGVNLYDISNPDAPFHLDHITTYGPATNVDVSGSHVYVLEQGFGLGVYSFVKKGVVMIHQPESRSLALGDQTTLQVKAYATNPLSYMWYLGESGDTSRPLTNETRPTISTHPITEQQRYWVRVTDGVSTFNSDTCVLTPIPTTKVELIGRWPEDPNAFARSGFSTDVAVSGHHIYLADGFDGLRILNASDLTAPRMVGHYSSNIHQVAIERNRLHVNGRGYETLNIDNPTQPIQEVLVTESEEVMLPFGNFVFMGGGNGWNTLDQGNPMRAGGIFPSNVLSQNETWSIKGIAASGSYAAASQGWGGVQILDITSPTSPNLVTSYYPNASVQDLAWKNSWIIAAHGDLFPGLELIDVSDPANPKPSASMNEPHAHKVAFMESSYAAVTGKGLSVFDYGDPSRLIKVSSDGSDFDTYGLEIHGDLAYVAAGKDGLLIYRITPELKLNPPSVETDGVHLSWLGAPGIWLQQSATMPVPNWTDVPDTEGASEILIPFAQASHWYQLIKR